MSFDCRQALGTLTEQLAALPIEVHLADEPLLIERCSLFLTNALRFWHEHRAKIPSVEALTVILSHDYHHIMKTGSRDIRHLINIYGANREEVTKARDILATDVSLAEVEPGSLSQLIEEGIELDRQLRRGITSAIAKVGNVLDALQKASIKLWNKSSVDASVIPENFFLFRTPPMTRISRSKSLMNLKQSGLLHGATTRIFLGETPSLRKLRKA